jgi:acetylornithine deacetylase/succinyl-diaminopimelate desuccinylase-like protein
LRSPQKQRANALTAQQQRAFEIYKELTEINTVTQTGDTARAADAMAARLNAAGFDSVDVQVFKPAPRKGSLVARLRGTGAKNAQARSRRPPDIGNAHQGAGAQRAVGYRRGAYERHRQKTSAEFWPGVPVVPVMSAGATDGSFLRNAGIPTYGHSGLASDVDDVRAHGKDERVAVKSFFEGGEYLYRAGQAAFGG